MIAVLTGCGLSADSSAAQLAFEAQMNVDSAQRFYVSLGVRNMGRLATATTRPSMPP
jgi:hypothetical protein